MKVISITLFSLLIVTVALALPSNKRDERVIGGELASPGSFPYMVSLRDSKRNEHGCGGCILTNRTILTAAHCILGIRPSDIWVATGSTKLDSGEVKYQALRLVSHPEFSTFTAENDVGLLIVDREIEFNALTQPIPLGRRVIGVEERITLSGWGTTSYPGIVPNDLQYIHLRTISYNECKTAYDGINPVFENQLCTSNGVGQGACHFDSGSPAVDNGTVVGIVNWGFACGLGYPDVFARVTSFLNWIDRNVV